MPDRAQPHGPSNAISEFARFLRTETTGGLIMLAAAVLAISLFTIYFAAQMVVRPFDEAARRPLPPKENL